MKKLFIILFILISVIAFPQKAKDKPDVLLKANGDSVTVYTIKDIEDVELYNSMVNDTNGYPRGGVSSHDALQYTLPVYDSIDKEYLLILDKVTYKALKDADIKVVHELLK